MVYYRPTAQEVDIFDHTHARQLPLMLKGPTGCGKSRFVEAMAARLDLPLVTVSCHDDTSAADLLGRHLLKGQDTIWQDGPVARAIRTGGILYLDEVTEAREDVLVVLHALTDHRRQIFLDRNGETLLAPSTFQLIISFNPNYQKAFKQLKPSTRQRFVGLTFDYPEPVVEEEIVAHESGVSPKMARSLVLLAKKIRTLSDLGLGETVSTRLLIHAGLLMASGMEPRLAARLAIVESLSDAKDAQGILKDLVDLIL